MAMLEVHMQKIWIKNGKWMLGEILCLQWKDSPGPSSTGLEGKFTWPQNKCAMVCPRQMEEIRIR